MYSLRSGGRTHRESPMEDAHSTSPRQQTLNGSVHIVAAPLKSLDGIFARKSHIGHLRNQDFRGRFDLRLRFILPVSSKAILQSLQQCWIWATNQLVCPVVHHPTLTTRRLHPCTFVEPLHCLLLPTGLLSTPDIPCPWGA